MRNASKKKANKKSKTNIMKIKKKAKVTVKELKKKTQDTIVKSNQQIAHDKKLENLKKMLKEDNVTTISNKQKEKQTGLTLRDRMMKRLRSARFRYINEKLYKIEGKDAVQVFKEDPQAFEAYHKGYQQQVASWPVNPVNIVIEYLKKRPKTNIIADLGCGDAKIAQSIQHKVHSFDLVATNDNVIECDMAKVPLKNSSMDVIVYCLSLMGTNLRDYLFEGSRLLNIGGIMIIAEIQSRLESLETFIKTVEKFGFVNTKKDLSHNMFYFLQFKKVRDVKQKNKMPHVSLKACLYKKR